MGELTKLEMPDNYLYISHLDEQLQYQRLPFQPETISDTMSSTFTPSSALGRSAPVYTYSQSGPRSVQISIPLHRDLMDDMNMGFCNAQLETGEDYLDALVRALQAIVVPKYNLTNKAVEPPLVALKIGEELFIKGIVNGSIGVTREKPILSNNKYARMTLSITITEVDPYDATSVYANGSFRGLTNTMREAAKRNIGVD